MTPAEWDAKAAALFAEFRENNGVLGGEFSGIPLLILHTADADDGHDRANMMMYLEDGGRRIVIASHSGLPENPVWYGNLLRDGSATIEVNGVEETVVAAEVLGEERDRLYALQAETWPDFREYETRTSRRIPVIALTTT
ncbi:nitroreductase/quinone reductase family protein [Nocardioides sp. LS1]|uniref:nitroreductase/quinone reductase family protein n=1 Tax=Nocardioides sp. LS1 TaxID=1027620 RepID=UPI000F61EC50|nr:nitroreductase/quinone reductase family protein [Nocardioides sp. LS1]